MADSVLVALVAESDIDFILTHINGRERANLLSGYPASQWYTLLALLTQT